MVSSSRFLEELQLKRLNLITVFFACMLRKAVLSVILV